MLAKNFYIITIAKIIHVYPQRATFTLGIGLMRGNRINTLITKDGSTNSWDNRKEPCGNLQAYLLSRIGSTLLSTKISLLSVLYKINYWGFTVRK